MLSIPVTMGVAKVQTLNWRICDVVIRHIITNIVPAVVAEIQGVHGGVELHPYYIPNAYSSSSWSSSVTVWPGVATV